MPYKNLKKEVKARRKFLIKILGGKCEECGERGGLQFHHNKPRTWIARLTGRLTRLKRYYQDAARGEIDLLCAFCNKTSGKPF